MPSSRRMPATRTSRSSLALQTVPESWLPGDLSTIESIRSRVQSSMNEETMKRLNSVQRDREISEAVKLSRSIAEVLRNLGMRVGGGNYMTVQRAVKELQLDTSHWTGQGHRKGSRIPVVPAQPLEAVLVQGSHYKSSDLRRRLIAEGVFPARCSRCAQSRWLGSAISLELDHIDGDRNNNSLTNLRLLCPNCHATTPTYRGRNTRGRKRRS